MKKNIFFETQSATQDFFVLKAQTARQNTQKFFAQNEIDFSPKAQKAKCVLEAGNFFNFFNFKNILKLCHFSKFYSIFILFIFCFSIFSCKAENFKNKKQTFSIQLNKNKAQSEQSEQAKDEQENFDELVLKAQNDKNIDFWSDYPADILAAEIASRMSDEELLAQMFMFGWAGAEPSKLVTYWVENRNIGSIKIFGWNTDDVELVAKNITTLQKKSMNGRFRIPLYVATDQEGGWIRHVKGSTSDTPGNLAIGASSYPQDAFYTGYYIAKELRALGINMNFAPAVDLYSNHASTVIGPRSFGENAEQVAILANAFAAGSLQAGVLPTAKHFPGHGDTDLDSHGKLPIIDIDRETLFNRELVPFESLINGKIPAIMTGHLAFPQITHNQEPASLSKTFIKTILRSNLGFEGLVISDDMMMNGATTFAGGLSEAFTMAIDAGNNILCSSTTPQINASLWTSNLEKMKTTPSFRRNVLKSAELVLRTKMEYFKGENFVPIFPEIEKIASSVPDKEGTKFFMEQACRSMTLYKKGNFPILPNTAGKVLFVAQFQEFFDEGIKRFPGADLMYIKYTPNISETENARTRLKNIINNYDTIIYLVPNQANADIAQSLKGTSANLVIVSALSPVPVMKDFEWANSILMCYSYSDFSFRAAFSAIAGDYNPEGVLPLFYKNEN